MSNPPRRKYMDCVNLRLLFLLKPRQDISGVPGSHLYRIDFNRWDYRANISHHGRIIFQMSDLGPGINPHMPMFLETFKDVVLILLNFHVALKVEPLTFTRLMHGNEEPFGLTCHVIHIIWSQEMVPKVTVGLPSIYFLLGGFDISPLV